MHAKHLVSGITAAAILGFLAVSPAQAGSGLIEVTHSATYGKAVQAAPATVAKSQPKASKTTPAEIQVAVMAKAPSNPPARRSVFIHR
jgi:hypothetical protein